MTPNECPSHAVLGRYAAGASPVAEAQAIDTHVGTCTTCLRELELLGERPDPLVAALRRTDGLVPENNPVLEGAVAALLAAKKGLAVAQRAEIESGAILNGYRILEELGRGGMGRVYRAVHPRLGQEVALKVLRPGMDSAPILARFETERQTLALMDHPQIARVLDGGVTEDGRPFFVMELVRGIRITNYCEKHGLDVCRRLELFATVCQAVQHAHQKGIIHRDLKPSNVLVAEYDGEPAAKIIDFGVAKAMEQSSGAETEMGMLIGTPEYMSPEQADLTSRDIDTRSDIYSLGVVLYELLTGTTPFEACRRQDTPVLEKLRVIREVEPLAPSKQGLPARSGSPKGARLRELDWIVLKALDKERSLRYETAAAFAEDIRRFLQNEVVEAGPHSRVYRLKKFVRRNRGAVVAATVVLAAILTGTAATTVALIQTRQSEHRALDDRDASKAVSDFLAKDLLALASVYNQEGNRGARDPDIKVRTLLDLAANGIEGKFERQPRVEAQLRRVMGQVYSYLGDNETALKHLERSQDLAAFPPDSPETRQLLTDLAYVYRNKADYAQADRLLEQLIAAETRVGNHAGALLARLNRGLLYRDQGKYDVAVRLTESVLEDCLATLGPDHRTTLSAQQNLGSLYTDLGTYPRAEELLKAALDGRTRVQGPDHPQTITAINTLVALYMQRREYSRAEPLYHQALEADRRLLGPDHRNTLVTLNNLGNLYLSMNRFDDAEKYLTQAWEARRRVNGSDHPDTLNCRSNLCLLYMRQRKGEKAEQCYCELAEAQGRVQGAGHPMTLIALNNLASLYIRRREYSRAESVLRQVLDGVQQSPAPRWDLLSSAFWNLTDALLRQKKWSDAELVAREFLTQCRKRQPDSIMCFSAQCQLGQALVNLERFAEAEPLLIQGYHGIEERRKELGVQLANLRINEAIMRVIDLYIAWGKPEEAAKWRAKLPPPKAAAKKAG